MEKDKNLAFFEKSLQMPKAKDIAISLINNCKKGNISPLKINVALKKFSKTLEIFEKNEKIKEQVFNEIKQYQEGKTSKVYGARITEQSRGYYDFTECNDPYWEELSIIKKKVEGLLKEREAFLKTLHPDNKANNFKNGVIDFKIEQHEEVINKTYQFKIKKVDSEIFAINPPKKGAKTVLAFSV